MMENVLTSENDIIYMKSLSVNNMLQLPLVLYNLDTDNIPFVMKLLNIAMSVKILQIRTLPSNDI